MKLQSLDKGQGKNLTALLSSQGVKYIVLELILTK